MTFHLTHLLTVCALVIAFSANAATSILTSETKVTVRTPQTDTLVIDNQMISAEGNTGLCFTTPKYPGSGEEWPAFEFKPAVTDWSEYDRLVIDLVNTSQGDIRFNIYISDSKTPFREYMMITPSPLGISNFQRVEVSLGQLAKFVDLKDISIVHFFTERPSCDVQLQVAGQVLLRPGEELPEYSPEYREALKALAAKTIDASARTLEDNYHTLAAQQDEELHARLDKELGRLRQRIQVLRDE